MRPDADAAAVVGHLGDREQLDDAAHGAGAGDVGAGDLGDALAVDVGGGDPGVEGQRGEDRRLGRGVEALDVGGRVGLGVAERLRLLERVGEAGAALGHPGEDVVGGAVDDAEHPADPVAGQRLAQRPQDRDRPGDRGLVVEVDAVLVGRVEQRRAVLGEQRLVGGDDRGAGLQRGQDQRAGRLDAADDLDDDVDVVPGRQGRGVGGEQRGVDRQVAAVAGDPAYGDAGQLERAADPGGQVVGVRREQPGDLAADGAAAEQRDAQRTSHARQPVRPRLQAPWLTAIRASRRVPVGVSPAWSVRPARNGSAADLPISPRTSFIRPISGTDMPARLPPTTDILECVSRCRGRAGRRRSPGGARPGCRPR